MNNKNIMSLNVSEICCICLENTCNNNIININCCKQPIHKLCLKEWIITKGLYFCNCPICRRKICNLNLDNDDDDNNLALNHRFNHHSCAINNKTCLCIL